MADRHVLTTASTGDPSELKRAQVVLLKAREPCFPFRQPVFRPPARNRESQYAEA